MAIVIAAARDGRGPSAFVCVLVGTFALYTWWEAAKVLGVPALVWRHRGITVVGRVVWYDDGSDGSGNFPVIEYTTVDGEVFEHRSDVGRWRRNELGGIEITYDPKRPQRICETLSPWRAFVACLLLAMGSLLLGLVLVDGLPQAF